MVLYYALGGGLGHLTRARRVLSELGLRDRAAILTSSRFSRDPRVMGGIPVVAVPATLGRDRAAFARWLSEMLAALRPDELIVDSFPGGILGELCGLALPPARHVARRLRWPAYARRLSGELPRYEEAYVLEELHPSQGLALVGSAVRPLSLGFGEVAGVALVDGPHVLVVHSGSESELDALIEYATEVRDAGSVIVVVSPRRPARLPSAAMWHDIYPVTPYLAAADLVVSAAGFNVMHELAGMRERHRAIPFPRPLDDQYWRARAAQVALAGAS